MNTAITADVETPVSELITLMTDPHIMRLPITEEGKLVGVVARGDVLKTLREPEFARYA
jgi:CBS domain-containing protein